MAPISIQQYTEQDVKDVYYVAGVTMQEGDTVRDRLWNYEENTSPLNFNDPDDMAYFKNVVLKEAQERYDRGWKIAETCDLVHSSRFTCLGSNDYEQMSKGRTIVSPANGWPAGYIATTEAERYYALALRKDYLRLQQEQK